MLEVIKEFILSHPLLVASWVAFLVFFRLGRQSRRARLNQPRRHPASFDASTQLVDMQSYGSTGPVGYRPFAAIEPLPHAEAQEDDISVVTSTIYGKKNVLNHSELGVFYALKDGIRTAFGDRQFHIFCQVPLGVFLTTDEGENEAYWRIFSKRPDFVIVDNKSTPLAVVEFNGGGHEGRGPELTGRADEMKRLALQSAGIELHYIRSNNEVSFCINQIVRRLAELKNSCAPAS